MGKVIEHFAHAIPALSHAERHVLYYIENNLQTARNLSLTELAGNNNVSTTTVVRMCHKLGLEGFSELKFLLKNMEQDILPADMDVINRHERDVVQTLSELRREDVSRICSMMQSADKIIIISVGLSKMIGEYFSKLLMQVNKSTVYAYESHIIDLLSNKVDRKDLVIFISSSGETATIVKVAEKLKYQHHQTAALINTPGSSLAKLVSVSLHTHAEPVEYAGYDLTARSPLLLLVDILFESFLLQTVKK